MTNPEESPDQVDATPLDPALELLLARLDDALSAGFSTEEVGRQIAERFGPEASEMIATVKALHAAGAQLDSSRPQQGDTWSASITLDRLTVSVPQARFGRFELLGRIGAGGSGIVFRARDPHLHRLVALKVARAETLFSNEARQRFLREARFVASLRHPNIISVYEAGEADGLPYIVEELCDGPNLAAWLRQQTDEGRPVPILVAARWMAMMAQAVAHAHEGGIVHRDLKPANVLLEMHPESGLRRAQSSRVGRRESAEASDPSPHATHLSPLVSFPRITDFGVAKLFGSDEAVTVTHAVLGTAAYMAPEQAEGKTRDVGTAADVYSLGVILYEMLTGRRPIEGRTDVDTMRRLATVEPALPARLRADVPRDLQAICMKCLEKVPARRYPTGIELAQDLERFLEGRPVTARPVGLLRRTGKAYARHQRVVEVAIIGCLLLALGSAIVIGRLRTEQAAQVGSAADYTGDIRGVFNLWHENAERLRDNPHAGEEMAALLSRYIPRADESDRRGFEWHYLWRLCHPERAVGRLPRVATLKGHKDDVYFVTFSRDGSRLVSCGRDRTARIWDAATGRMLCVCSGHSDDVNWVDFSPDQTRVATASDDQSIKIWDARTGKEQFTLRGHNAQVVCVLFTPDGRSLFSADHQGVLNLWNLESKRAVKSIVAHQGRIQCLSLSADGRLLVSSSDRDQIRLWTLPEFVAYGEVHTNTAQCVTLSPDGNTLACGGGGTISIYDARTGGLRSKFSHHSGNIESVRFSPDGRQLASSAGDGTLRLWDIPSRQDWLAIPARTWLNNANEPVTAGLWCVAYSPDGRRLVTSARDGLIEIWDTSVTPQCAFIGISTPDRRIGALSFSPDGRRLAIGYLCGAPEASGFQVWDVSGGRPTLLRDVSGIEPHDLSFSISGDELAAAGERYVDKYRLETGERQLRIKLPENRGARQIAFERNGALLVLESLRGSVNATIRVYDAQNGVERNGLEEPFPCAHFECTGGFIVSDQARLLIATPDARTPVVLKYDATLNRFSRRTFAAGHGSAHGAVAPVEPLVALASHEGIELWNPEQNRQIGLLPGLSNNYGPFRFSSDGRLLIVVFRDQRSVYVWNVPERKELFTLPLPPHFASPAVDQVAVSPDGRKVAIPATNGSGHGGVFLYSGLEWRRAGGVRRALLGIPVLDNRSSGVEQEPACHGDDHCRRYERRSLRTKPSSSEKERVLSDFWADGAGLTRAC